MIDASPVTFAGDREVPVTGSPRLGTDLSLQQLATLRAVRYASVHHGWATAFEVGETLQIREAHEALQMNRDLLHLHFLGHLVRAVPPGLGPVLWKLTGPGRAVLAWSSPNEGPQGGAVA